MTSLALPAFLASAASTDLLQSTMMEEATPADQRRELQLTSWLEASAARQPEGNLASKQSAWDGPLIEGVVSDLFARMSDPKNQARLRAVSAPHAGDWLQALPVTNCGLRLDDESVRVAAGLRLGVPLCEPHGCPCGAPVSADGHHGLSCALGPGRLPRHASLNDLIFRGLVRAGFPSTFY